MSIVEVHSRLANAAILYAGVMALWAIFQYIKKSKVTSSYWGAAVIAEVLILIQGAIGLYIYASGTGYLARSFMHILYGIVAVLIIPGVFLFTKGSEERRVTGIYAIAFIFLAGILIRSMSTGG